VPTNAPSLARRAVAEGIGTALLLAAVVGSGVMGERLAGGNVAIALLANSISTGAALIALILTFGPLSGAHFNPLVTAISVWRGDLARRDLPVYVIAQMAGAFAGVVAANAMFGEPLFAASQHARAGLPLAFAEAVATFGLLSVIVSCARHRGDAVPLAVGSYIAAAYWFTSSTSFANPAVTLARTVTDTFAGIRPADAPAFLVAQILATVAAALVLDWLV
jgi:glycerol uptake facilitator-like aquaporin